MLLNKLVYNELNKKHYFIVKVHLVSMLNLLELFVLLTCSHVISFSDTSDESFEGIFTTKKIRVCKGRLPFDPFGFVSGSPGTFVLS